MKPMDDQPTVSVCVVTYNQRNYIKDCVLSVLTQAFDTRLEILVGDDGSSDGTADVVESIARQYPGLVTLYRHPQNLGASGNYQFLIGRAKGRYIAHLDGDDYWLPGKLAAQLRHFDRHPGCVAVYSNAAVITEAGELYGSFNNPQPTEIDTEYLVRKGNFLNHSSMLYRSSERSVVLSMSGRFIDYAMHLGLAKRGALGYVNEALVVYRAGLSQSMSSSTPDLVRHLYWEALLAALREPSASRYAAPALTHFWAQTVFGNLTHGQFRRTWQWARRIRHDVPAFSAWQFIHGILASSGEACWQLVARLLSRRLYGSRVRLLHRR